MLRRAGHTRIEATHVLVNILIKHADDERRQHGEYDVVQGHVKICKQASTLISPYVQAVIPAFMPISILYGSLGFTGQALQFLNGRPDWGYSNNVLVAPKHSTLLNAVFEGSLLTALYESSVLRLGATSTLLRLEHDAHHCR